MSSYAPLPCPLISPDGPLYHGPSIIIRTLFPSIIRGEIFRPAHLCTLRAEQKFQLRLCECGVLNHATSLIRETSRRLKSALIPFINIYMPCLIPLISFFLFQLCPGLVTKDANKICTYSQRSWFLNKKTLTLY